MRLCGTKVECAWFVKFVEVLVGSVEGQEELGEQLSYFFAWKVTRVKVNY